MEKRGKTTDNLPDLIKQADSEEKVFALNIDGFEKYASGKGKPGVIIIATGPRADVLRRVLGDLLE